MSRFSHLDFRSLWQVLFSVKCVQTNDLQTNRLGKWQSSFPCGLWRCGIQRHTSRCCVSCFGDA